MVVKSFLKTSKHDSTKNGTILPKIRQAFRFWFPFWSNLHGFRPVARLFRDLFFGTSGEYPLKRTDFDFPWGKLGPILSVC